MDFRRGKYKYELSPQTKTSEDNKTFGQTNYTYKGSNGVILSCSVEDDTSRDSVIAQKFSLTAELKGNIIGTISGALISPLEILDDPHDPYLWCDGENDLLPDMYLCMLRCALPMEYVRFFERYVPRDEVDRANAVSERFYDFLCGTDYMESIALLVTHIFVEEKYINSGLFSVMYSTLQEIFDICCMSICIDPIEADDSFEGGRLFKVVDSEKEEIRIFKIAEHYGFDVPDDFLHDTTGDDTMIAVWSSDYLNEFLEDEDFSEAIEAVDTASEMDPEKTLLFPEDD